MKPDTGEYVWHYQEVPGDAWDYDAVSPMMTADLTLGGKKTHVLLQPSKNGFMYVLDAKTGKLMSADAFTEVNWATGVDLKTGRPIEVPAARYENEPWNLAPGVQGGHSWHPNAFSPLTGLRLHPRVGSVFHDGWPRPGQRRLPTVVQSRHHDGREGRARQTEALRPARCQRSPEGVGSGRAQGRVGIEAYTNAGPTSGVLATARQSRVHG